jgi:hypothetical protein
MLKAKIDFLAFKAWYESHVQQFPAINHREIVDIKDLDAIAETKGELAVFVHFDDFSSALVPLQFLTIED